MIRRTRTAAAALACAALLTGVTACSQSEGRGERLDSPLGGGAFAGGATSGSTPAPGSQEDGSARCRTADLKAEFQLQPQTPNTALLIVKNITSHSCTVYGYPGIALQDTTGRYQTLAKTDRVPHPGPPMKITLSSGTVAFAGTRFVRDTAGGCDGGIYDQVMVTPPDETSQLVTPVMSEEGGGRTAKLAVCDGMLSVGTLQPSNQGVLF